MKKENKSVICSDYAQKVWNMVFSGYLVVIGGKSNYVPSLFFAKGTSLYSWNRELGELRSEYMSREDFCRHIDDMISEGIDIVEVKIQ